MDKDTRRDILLVVAMLAALIAAGALAVPSLEPPPHLSEGVPGAP